MMGHTPPGNALSLGFFGWLGAASAIGAVVASVFCTAWASHLGVTRLYWASFLIAGICVVVYARLTQFYPALIVSFLISFCATITSITLKPIIYHVTPRAFLGRIFAVGEPVTTLTALLSINLIGWVRSDVLNQFHIVFLGASFGPNDTIFIAAGVITIIAGWYAMISVRNVKLTKEGGERADDDNYEGNIGKNQ